MLDKYKLIGQSYDLISKVYSGNTILECKNAMLQEDLLNKDIKVLFAGSGQGKDALKAAELGAQVTLIDISPTMMDSFINLLSKHPDKDKLQIESILGDILKHEHFGEYDMVVANFFLSTFDERKMNTVLSHLVRLSKPGGHIVIGDFCPPQGNFLKKTFQQVYWYSAATAFFAVAGNPIHGIHDYKIYAEKKNLQLVDEQFFSFLGKDSFYSLLFQKNKAENV